MARQYGAGTVDQGEAELFDARPADLGRSTAFAQPISGALSFRFPAPAANQSTVGFSPDSGAIAREFLSVVYNELLQLAACKLSSEDQPHRLEPRDLLHEAWLRLNREGQPVWKDRAYFFASLAEAMRRTLVEHGRQRHALKRGGAAEHINLDEIDVPITPTNSALLVTVTDALERLAAVRPCQAKLIELRYFKGLTFKEAAEVLGIAVPTAKEWWASARAWLALEIR